MFPVLGCFEAIVRRLQAPSKACCDCVEKAREDGYSNGHPEGYDKGYEKGYKDGQPEGE